MMNTHDDVIAALRSDREALYELLNRAQHHMAPRLTWIDERERDDYLRTMQQIDSVLALWRHAREARGGDV
jgi:hypothetical protein